MQYWHCAASILSSIELADVDPRYDSLSRAYRIIVRTTKAEEPSGFHFAVTHVPGLFCNASAKYAHLLTPSRSMHLAEFQGWTSPWFICIPRSSQESLARTPEIRPIEGTQLCLFLDC
jgi:hypothetical protein